MKATKEAEQKIALVRADTKRFTEEELPLLHKDQVELSAAVVEARSRAEAAKSRLREHEEQRKRTIQAVEVDSVSTAARLARAKEQAAAATSKDQVVAKGNAVASALHRVPPRVRAHRGASRRARRRSDGGKPRASARAHGQGKRAEREDRQLCDRVRLAARQPRALAMVANNSGRAARKP